MRELGTGRAALVAVEAERFLLDATLTDLTLAAADGVLRCDLDFRPRDDRTLGRIRLMCEEVSRFDFNWNDQTSFFEVERYKLLERADGAFYLSLDPYDEGSTENDDDAGVIICGRLRAMGDVSAEPTTAAA